jgi:hypothetical protein
VRHLLFDISTINTVKKKINTKSWEKFGWSPIGHIERVTIEIDLNTPSVHFYKEQFGKNTQTKGSYFFI